MAHCYKDELIEKAKELGVVNATYTDDCAYWQGDGWAEESGYFTEDGVCRFADTPMEIFETYDEIDEQILENCICCVDDDTVPSGNGEANSQPYTVVMGSDAFTPTVKPSDAEQLDLVYAVVEHSRVDFCGNTVVIAVCRTEEQAKQRFREAVETEKARQKKFGYSYDTVEESDTTYLAFDEGYEATDSIGFFVTPTKFIG